jgi:tetratricopeptide (TPR) repeat protein
LDRGYGTSGSGYGYDTSGYGYGSYGSGYSNPYSLAPAASSSDASAYSASADPVSSTTTTASASHDAAANSEDISTKVVQRMDVAVRAFKSNDYAAAQKECEQAIELQQTDGNLHEFRALCQFAQGKYKEAAATLHPLLAAGPGWNWNTVSAFYAHVQIYTAQLRTLEQFVRDNATDVAARFVLAYHYLVLDARDPAIDQLREVSRLQPQDTVSTGIVQALGKASQNIARPSAENPTPAQ